MDSKICCLLQRCNSENSAQCEEVHKEEGNFTEKTAEKLEKMSLTSGLFAGVKSS